MMTWPCRMLVLLAALTGLGACTERPRDETVIRFWAMGKEGEVAAALVAEFERHHPGIRVKVQQLPWSAAHEKLLTAFAGGALPDVAQLGNSWIPEMAALGALAAIGGRVGRSPSVAAQDYFPGIWQTNIIGGVLYGVPWYVDTRLLFYRRDILAAAGIAQPPDDWASWLAALDAIKRRAGPGRYGVLLPLNEYEPLVALALQQDTPLLRDGGRYGNFRSAAFRETLGFYNGLFAMGHAPVLTNNQISNMWDEFARGHYAFLITGPWNVGQFRRRLPSHLQDAWTTAPLPGPGGPGASNAGGSSLVIFASSDKQAAAWQLIEFLSHPDTQARFSAMTGNLPARRSAWQDDPHMDAFRQQLERVKPTPKVPEWERIATNMRLVAEIMVRGGLSVDEAAAEMDARADRVLEKRRWILAREAGQ